MFKVRKKRRLFKQDQKEATNKLTKKLHQCPDCQAIET